MLFSPVFSKNPPTEVPCTHPLSPLLHRDRKGGKKMYENKRFKSLIHLIFYLLLIILNTYYLLIAI